jgi:hypothetical protein
MNPKVYLNLTILGFSVKGGSQSQSAIFQHAADSLQLAVKYPTPKEQSCCLLPADFLEHCTMGKVVC